MFPFLFPCCGSAKSNCTPTSKDDFRQKQIEFLKWSRDNLEARLAALNAMISTLETQSTQASSHGSDASSAE